MFVFSQQQITTLLETDYIGGRLLDIGAGDGNVTSILAPLVDAVITTEASSK